MDHTLHKSEDGHDALTEALQMPVQEALGSSMESRGFWVAWEDATVGDALEPLTGGVHRLLVPVCDSGETSFYICSQLDIVSYLYKHSSEDSVLSVRKDGLRFNILTVLF